MKGSRPSVLVAVFIAALAGFSHAQLTRVTNTSLQLPADLPSTSAYGTQDALSLPSPAAPVTFAAPMVVTSIAGETNRLFVAERAGTIQCVTGLSGTPVKTAYFSISSLLASTHYIGQDSENGFLSLVFHPNFATNRTFFVYFSFYTPAIDNPDPTPDVPARLYQRLHRVVVTSATSNTATVESQEPLLTLRDRASNHNGGDLHFGPDGYLYLSLGDEGGGGDNYNNARFITQRNDSSVRRHGFWGQLLRIDPDKRSGNLAPNPSSQDSPEFPSAVHAGSYLVPADNPFIGRVSWHNLTISSSDVRTEIWATGLRNPFRWSFDPPSGRAFVADVGQGAYEEINIVPAGGDMGWSWREGLHEYNSPPSPQDPPGTGFSPIDPIFEYDRVQDNVGNDAILIGTSVTGGMVYRGNRLTELYGAYIFADYNSGRIAALRENNGVWTGQRLATDARISDFGVDPRNGDLLFCDLEEGRIKRLTRTTSSGTQPPATLSAVGVFSNLATLAPQPGIVPYDVNVPFWSDHAAKRRWFALRNGTSTVGYSRDTNWTLPTGMVWIKHFDFETVRGTPSSSRKLETRVLVKTAAATYGLSYRWREDQTDADLVDESGASVPINVTVGGTPGTQTWRFPSRAECATCHTSSGGHALSFNTRQLNLDHVYGSQTQNQIAALGLAGYLTAPAAAVHTLPAYAPASDTTQSLEWRARSYFAVNCSQCHQPGGPATGNWDARATTLTDAAAIINGPLVNIQGNAANRFVVPGNTARSAALQRLLGNPSRMPPVGTNVVNQEAVDLITAWINQSLPTRQSFAEWQLAQFGSPLPANSGADQDADSDGNTNRTEYFIGTNPKSPNPTSLLGIQLTDNQIQFNYTLPANRSLVIEASPTMLPNTWSLWDVSGNSPFFQATGGTRTRTFPLPASAPMFFRARVSAP